jgi:hypothetical protein
VTRLGDGSVCGLLLLERLQPPPAAALPQLALRLGTVGMARLTALLRALQSLEFEMLQGSLSARGILPAALRGSSLQPLDCAQRRLTARAALRALRCGTLSIERLLLHLATFMLAIAWKCLLSATTFAVFMTPEVDGQQRGSRGSSYASCRPSHRLTDRRDAAPVLEQLRLE